MWTFYELKTRAKTVLSQSYWKSLLAILICSLIGGGISLNINTNSIMTPEFTNIETAIANNFGLFSGLFSSILVYSLLVMFFITFPFAVGQTRFFNESARGNISLKEIFYPFTNGISNYLNIVKVGFFRLLFLILWGMLSLVVLIPIAIITGVVSVISIQNSVFAIIGLIFAVYIALMPMIIKTYEYFFVEYILADEPGIGWREALKKSKEMTHGNKFRIFLLYLSFMGWFLLGFAFLGFGTIFVMPYVNATFTELYLKLKSNIDSEYVYSLTNHEEV